MEYDTWYHYTYLKKDNTVSIWIDGVKDSEVAIGVTSGNKGAFWISGDPWYNSLTRAGYDNFQVHNKALSEEEIQTTVGGAILFNDNLVLAYDFGEISDNKVRDLSPYGNDGVINGVTFPEGGAPEGHHVYKLPPPGAYMEVDGSADYLEIPHTEDLELGKDNADFTVSFGLL